MRTRPDYIPSVSESPCSMQHSCNVATISKISQNHQNPESVFGLIRTLRTCLGYIPSVSESPCSMQHSCNVATNSKISQNPQNPESVFGLIWTLRTCLDYIPSVSESPCNMQHSCNVAKKNRKFNKIIKIFSDIQNLTTYLKMCRDPGLSIHKTFVYVEAARCSIII